MSSTYARSLESLLLGAAMDKAYPGLGLGRLFTMRDIMKMIDKVVAELPPESVDTVVDWWYHQRATDLRDEADWLKRNRAEDETDAATETDFE